MASVLRYYKKYNGENEWVEVSREKALDSLLTTYRDNDMTRDMLTIPNRIEYRFGTIEVKEHKENGSVVVLAPGLCNMLPIYVEYTETGKRKKRKH